MSWLSQYFLNPSFVLPGAALAAVPIIIHLLSRLRYKRIRFAAMEFLLQSDELNRRRLILEQLLLLLLRVFAVFLAVFLIARLVLDPSRMLLLRGATTHHVVILDDSLSMRQHLDDRMAFDHSIDTLINMISQNRGGQGSIRVTVLTTTQPDRPLVTDRALDASLVPELTTRLRNLKCSFRAATPVAALYAAANVLSGDGSVSPQVHVLTDLRKSDWLNQPELVASLKSLDVLKAEVQLIQIVPETADNVVLSEVQPDTQATAVGIPWRMNLTFRNSGSQRSSGLRGTIFVDGNPLPVRLLLPDIEPGATESLAHDIVFESPGQHGIEVRLEDDVLPEDNARFTVVEVTERRSILVVDDQDQQQDAGYVSAALSADPLLTGLSAEVRTSDVLTSSDLDKYDCLYLLNIRELPADATQRLAQYVLSGGGIVWFPDDQANTTWYNTVLQSGSNRLFPVSLGTVTTAVQETEKEPAFLGPVFENHPIFAIYNLPDAPFADSVQVSQWFGMLASEPSLPVDSEIPKPKSIMRLRNGAPVAFEHTLGRGLVLTFLTTAGRRWSNWPVAPAAPGYVVTHLLIHQYLQKASEHVQQRTLGDHLRLEWPISRFTESVEVFLPTSEPDSSETSFLRLQATPVSSSLPDVSSSPAATPASQAVPERESTENSPPGPVPNEDLLSVSISQADRPGIYRIRRFNQSGEGEETWISLSVPVTESDLAIADATDIQLQADISNLKIVPGETAGQLSASDAGRELRWFVLGLLILILICEQLLSLRMSFHSEVKS